MNCEANRNFFQLCFIDFFVFRQEFTNRTRECLCGYALSFTGCSKKLKFPKRMLANLVSEFPPFNSIYARLSDCDRIGKFKWNSLNSTQCLECLEIRTHRRSSWFANLPAFAFYTIRWIRRVRGSFLPLKFCTTKRTPKHWGTLVESNWPFENESGSPGFETRIWSTHLDHLEINADQGNQSSRIA